MKKLFFLTLFSISLSCGSDDAKTTSQSDLLLGKWSIKTAGFVVNGEEQATTPETAPCNLPYNLNFMDAGFLQMYSCNPFSNPIQITEISGQWTVETVNGVTAIKTVFVNDSELNSTMTIKNIDSQHLKIYMPISGNNIRVINFERL